MTLDACEHPADRVERVVSGGVVVAALCGACLGEVPTNWACPDCEWIEVRRMCDVRPTLLPGLPCQAHHSPQKA